MEIIVSTHDNRHASPQPRPLGFFQRVMARVFSIGILLAVLVLIAAVFLIALPVALLVVAALVAFMLVIMLIALVRGMFVRRAVASMRADGRENVRVRRPAMDQPFAAADQTATTPPTGSTTTQARRGV